MSTNFKRPLEFVKGVDASIGGTKTLIDLVAQYSGTPKLDVDEAVDYVLSPAFPSKGNHTRDIVNDWYSKYFSRAYNDIVDKPLNFNRLFKHDDYWLQNRIEFVEMLAMHYTHEEWIKNKQVYKVDPDFANMLLKSGNPKFTKSSIDHIPCKTFYLDLTDLNLDPIIGVFVHVHVTDSYVTFYGSIIDKQLVSFSVATTVDLTKAPEVVEYEIGDLDKLEVFKCAGTNNEEIKKLEEALGIKREEHYINFNLIRALTIVIPAYLMTKEPNIVESSYTKSTYRKPKATSKIRNKFSEIQAWDIGVKYGKLLRDYTKEKTIKLAPEDGVEGSQHLRKSPRPHFVSGHYQVYWKGKGRTTPEVVWRDGFMRGGEEAADIEVHK